MKLLVMSMWSTGKRSAVIWAESNTGNSEIKGRCQCDRNIGIYTKHIDNFWQKEYNIITNTCKTTAIYLQGEMFMAEQVLIQFRADKALKQEVTEIYERLGMDLPTAFRMFMTRSKMVKGLPFEATLPEQTITRVEAKNAFYELRKQAADVPEMSLDEINAEISAVRAERKR